MLKTEMLLRNNWSFIICHPVEGEKMNEHCKKWDQSIEDVMDEVGIQGFYVFNGDNENVSEGFAEDILCESYDWECRVEEYDEDEWPFDSFEKFVKVNGQWKGLDNSIESMIA